MVNSNRGHREKEDCGDSVWPSDTFRPFIPVSPNQTMQTVHGAEYTKQMGRTLFLGQNHKDHSLAAAKVQIWQNRMDQCGMGEGTSLHRLCIDLAPTTVFSLPREKGITGGIVSVSSTTGDAPASASSQHLSGKSDGAFLLEHESFPDLFHSEQNILAVYQRAGSSYCSNSRRKEKVGLPLLEGAWMWWRSNHRPCHRRRQA